MRKLVVILLILSATWPSLGQEVITARRRAAAGAPPTSSPSASNIGNSSTGTTGITTPGTTFAGVSGSLVFLTSKTAAVSPGATVVFTLTGATCSASTLTGAVYVTGNFSKAAGWCLLSNTATVTPSVTWTGGQGTFTDMTQTMFTSTSGFAASPLDQSINTAFSTTAGTSCASGNTSATTNANDLVVGVAFNFNTGQTYGSGTTGYTGIAASSRNTTAVQFKNVSSTGVQSFTIAITSDIWACDVYAFKML